jgi:enterochelin esterase family protein
MKLPIVLLFSVLSLLGTANEAPARKPGDYPLTADSLPQEGVPKGQLLGPFEWRSAIIRGTVRRYWVYVPAQYAAAKPAGLLVFHDGQRALNPKGPLRVDQVMENLIHKKDIPVMIGLFITPGNLSERYPEDLGMNNPNNRAQEYDVLTDAYARMLADELIPELKKTYNISDHSVGAPRHLPQGYQHDRQLRVHRLPAGAGQPADDPWRRPLSDAHPQESAEEHPHLPAGRFQRPR